MAMLKHQKHEQFAQRVAGGINVGLAYKEAGYKGPASSATTLMNNPNVKERIAELRDRHVIRFVVTRQYLTEAAVENLEKALGRKPVKLGPAGKEVFVYRGDVANRALQLLGSELAMFKEQKEIQHLHGKLTAMTDLELVTALATEAKALLEDHSSDSRESDNVEHDGHDPDDA